MFFNLSRWPFSSSPPLILWIFVFHNFCSITCRLGRLYFHTQCGMWEFTCFTFVPTPGLPFHRNHREGRRAGVQNCKGHKHNNLHSAHFSHPISSRSLARAFLDDSCVVHCRDFHFMKCFDSTILSRVDQNVLNVAVPAPFSPFIDAQQYLSVHTRLQVDQKCINSSFGAINTMPDVFILHPRRGTRAMQPALAPALDRKSSLDAR